MIASLIFYYFAIFLYTRSDADPCLSTNHVVLDDEWRSTENVITSLGDAHCDATMIETWYRVNPGILGNIATSAPALDSCGTQYPVWMDDDLPGTSSTSSVKMCLRTMFSVCQATWTIDVKNCLTFYVYELKQSTVCSSAYCFDPSSPTTTTTAATTTADTTTTTAATTTSDTTTTTEATTPTDTTTTTETTTTSDTTTTTTETTTPSDTTTTTETTTTSDTTTTTSETTTTSDTTTTTEEATSDTTTTTTAETTTTTVTATTKEPTTTISVSTGQHAVHEGMATGSVVGIVFAMLVLVVIIVVAVLLIMDKVFAKNNVLLNFSQSRSNNQVSPNVDTLNENPIDRRGTLKARGMPV